MQNAANACTKPLVKSRSNRDDCRSERKAEGERSFTVYARFFRIGGNRHNLMYVFYFFAAVLIYFSILSLRGGFRYLAFFKQETVKPKSDYAPFATIIAPCRGVDDGLQENLTALFQQNYPNYEIVFVVDDAQDAAVSIIQAAWRGVATNAKSQLAVAGKAIECGQKAHNLRFAVTRAAPESEVFAFVDSDARPSKDWLAHLVAPLQQSEVGAATGYRWFVGKRGNFSSELRSVWNASIASALGANTRKNFCWGGATAIRRETFERIKMSERWNNAVSDDFAVTRAMNENNLEIRFVPQCLTAAIEDCGFAELLEFTTRQMKITRVYAPHLWKASLVGSLLFTATFWSGVLLVIIRAIYDLSVWLPLAFLIAIFLLGAAKAYLRLRAVRLVLTDYETKLNRSFLPQILLWTITPPLYFYNCVCASFSRKIVWRGIAYELKSPTETEILSEQTPQ